MNENLSGLPLDHVAIATHSIRQTAPLYERVGETRCSRIEEIPSQGVRVAFIGPVELLEPLGPGSTVARFLDRRGPGLHHLAYRVDDLPGTLARLREAGVRLLDEAPREGARGHQVAFLHPDAGGGVLVELVALSGR